MWTTFREIDKKREGIAILMGKMSDGIFNYDNNIKLFYKETWYSRKRKRNTYREPPKDDYDLKKN